MFTRGCHIEVGARTSVQDGTVVHCTHDWPTLIGAECVVGHNAHLEGCVVGDRCLIGSGSITLNRVTVGAGAIVAAACLVPEGFEVPPGALVAGVPAKIKKTGVAAPWIQNPAVHSTAAIPWVVFTDPEVAQVGITGDQAAGVRGARVAHLPMREVDRAITAGRTDGFVTIIAGPRRATGNLGGGRVLGATIAASHAGEMIAEIALAMRAAMFTGRLAQTTHPYPTWSLAIQQAAAQFFGEYGGRTARPALSLGSQFQQGLLDDLGQRRVDVEDS